MCYFHGLLKTFDTTHHHLMIDKLRGYTFYGIFFKKLEAI